MNSLIFLPKLLHQPVPIQFLIKSGSMRILFRYENQIATVGSSLKNSDHNSVLLSPLQIFPHSIHRCSVSVWDFRDSFVSDFLRHSDIADFDLKNCLCRPVVLSKGRGGTSHKQGGFFFENFQH